MPDKKELKELARLFLRLGFTAFGGPAAHIALMQKEVVERRGWMSNQRFLDLLGATNLIPGPNSTEMAIHIGRERGGWLGLIVAGLCFISPAVLITGVIAWLYSTYGRLPQVNALLTGMKPAIIAVVLGAVFPLAKRAFKNAWFIVLGVAALAAALLGFNALIILFGAGGIVLSVRAAQRRQGAAYGMGAFLFFKFLKVGALLYGSGYVLFAYLNDELVAKGLLSTTQLADAIAIGQLTPGPVFSAATFIGWQMDGWHGAALATLGIFLPAFFFVALLNPIVRLMRRSALFSAFLDGVNVAAVSLVLFVCITLGRDVVGDWRSVLIGVLALVVVFGLPRVNSAFVIIGGMVLGWLLSVLVTCC
jgi:chromate transporter